MNGWARVLMGFAVAGLGGWLVTGVQGRQVAPPDERALLGLHTQLGFVSTLALLLADVWILVFLLLAARALARLAPDRPEAVAAGAEARRVAALGALACALVVSQPALAGLLYPDRLSATVHLLTGVGALVLEVVFLVLAGRALRRQARRFGALERPGAEPG